MDTTVRPRRILILDDEPSILELLDDYLRSLDFEPLSTSRWTEALDLITHNPPDLILLDLLMPTVQGDAVLEFIRQQGHTLPVIVISGHLNEQKMETLRRLGVKGFAPKPFQLKNLAAAIREALEPPAASVTPSPPSPKTPPASPPDAAVPEQAAYSVLEHDTTEVIAAHTKSGPSPHPHDGHRHHHHPPRRKPRNLKLYIVVSLVCVIGSLIVLLIEKLPAYMSGTLEKAMEKSMQSEMNRKKQDFENLSDKEKEALRKTMQKK